MADNIIKLEGVSKSYGSVDVIRDLNLEIDRGEFLALLGPSGSGKTTTLMMLAGFESVSSGRMLMDGRSFNDVPSHKRNMGVVFQNYALFPHMSVEGNVAFPLKMRKVAKATIQERIERALDLVQLTALRDRKPLQLSGGQQQRVALARALVFEPKVVLMDEPLGALDKQLRQQMQMEIRELHQRLGLTIIFVTHDQGEALCMSTRIAVFNRGAIEQIGTPTEIYERPQKRFVAEFIGETNLLEGTVTSADGQNVVVDLSLGGTISTFNACGNRPGDRVSISVRPEHISLASASDRMQGFKATVLDTIYLGDHLGVSLGVGETTLIAQLLRRGMPIAKGEAVHVTIDPADCWIVGQ